MRGFVLGTFMPPHSGHIQLCGTGLRLVDELTILVCHRPDDPIPGALRVAWMSELFPTARIREFGEEVPLVMDDSPECLQLWSSIVHSYHPEPIDYLFAGEQYGLELSNALGATFAPVGGRFGQEDQGGIGGVSATAIRQSPFDWWPHLPPPVRQYAAHRICLHGVESTGKSTLSEKLSAHYRTTWVPEYGRWHCHFHGTDLDDSGLLHIGKAQSAMAEASAAYANRRLFIDTDALMTAAWSEMMIGEVPAELFDCPKADLYLLLEPDVPWIDDGLRLYGDAERRLRFAEIAEGMLRRAGVNVVRISGDHADREAAAIEAVDALDINRLGGATHGSP